MPEYGQPLLSTHQFGGGPAPENQANQFGGIKAELDSSPPPSVGAAPSAGAPAAPPDAIKTLSTTEAASRYQPAGGM